MAFNCYSLTESPINTEQMNRLQYHGLVTEEYFVIILGYFFFFYYFSMKICSGYSSEVPRRSTSDEYLNIFMEKLRILSELSLNTPPEVLSVCAG